MYSEKLIFKNIGFFIPRKDQFWCHHYEQMNEDEKITEEKNTKLTLTENI